MTAMIDDKAALVWIKTTEGYPPAGRIVDTKVENAGGQRNHQALMLHGDRWWTPDGSIYVYYSPTHWRPLA